LADEIYVVWKGQVAVTEQTEFGEAILVYLRGTVLNLYQILMDAELPFNYCAVAGDEFACNLLQKSAYERPPHKMR